VAVRSPVPESPRARGRANHVGTLPSVANKGDEYGVRVRLAHGEVWGERLATLALTVLIAVSAVLTMSMVFVVARGLAAVFGPRLDR
jgi:hypothetical protein